MNLRDFFLDEHGSLQPWIVIPPALVLTLMAAWGAVWLLASLPWPGVPK